MPIDAKFYNWLCKAGFSNEEIQDIANTAQLSELPSAEDLDAANWEDE